MAALLLSIFPPRRTSNRPRRARPKAREPQDAPYSHQITTPDSPTDAAANDTPPGETGREASFAHKRWQDLFLLGYQRFVNLTDPQQQPDISEDDLSEGEGSICAFENFELPEDELPISVIADNDVHLNERITVTSSIGHQDDTGNTLGLQGHEETNGSPLEIIQNHELPRADSPASCNTI